jgi:hypothetical protein
MRYSIVLKTDTATLCKVYLPFSDYVLEKEHILALNIQGAK